MAPDGLLKSSTLVFKTTIGTRVKTITDSLMSRRWLISSSPLMRPIHISLNGFLRRRCSRATRTRFCRNYCKFVHKVITKHAHSIAFLAHVLHLKSGSYVRPHNLLIGEKLAKIHRPDLTILKLLTRQRIDRSPVSNE